MNFGDRLLQYRKQHHLTQKQLAEKLKTSQSCINMYENAKRKPGTSTVARIAKILKWNEFEIADIFENSKGEAVREPAVAYDVSQEPDLDRAFELMRKHLSAEEQSAVIDFINYLVREKR